MKSQPIDQTIGKGSEHDGRRRIEQDGGGQITEQNGSSRRVQQDGGDHRPERDIKQISQHDGDIRQAVGSDIVNTSVRLESGPRASADSSSEGPLLDTSLARSPRVKFRWSGGTSTLVSPDELQYQEVSLVFTSLTGTQVPLWWVPSLGWYESDLVRVCTGYHSGFLLVVSKDTSKTGAPTAVEHDYKVDSFFVTPHNQGIELFLQSERPLHFWQHIPPLRRRYLSSGHVGGSEVLGGGVGGCADVAGQKVRCVSLQELSSLEVVSNSDTGSESSRTERLTASLKLEPSSPVGPRKPNDELQSEDMRNATREFRNDQERFSEQEYHQNYGHHRLRQTRVGSPTDSSYHSRSRSAFFDIIAENPAVADDAAGLTSRSDEGKPSYRCVDNVNWHRLSDTDITSRRSQQIRLSRDSEGVQHNWEGGPQQSFTLESRLRSLSKSQLELIALETDAQIRAVEELLESSDSDFDEQDEPVDTGEVLLLNSITLDSSGRSAKVSEQLNLKESPTEPQASHLSGNVIMGKDSSILREPEFTCESHYTLEREDDFFAASRLLLDESVDALSNRQDLDSPADASRGLVNSPVKVQKKILLDEGGDVGPFGCVITFESRSTSLDDLGSPRALEEALVSLTSSHGGGVFDDPTHEGSSRRVFQLQSAEDLHKTGQIEDAPFNQPIHLLNEDDGAVGNVEESGPLTFLFEPGNFVTSSLVEFTGQGVDIERPSPRSEENEFLVEKSDQTLCDLVENVNKFQNSVVTNVSEIEDQNFEFESSEESEEVQFHIDMRGVNSDESTGPNVVRQISKPLKKVVTRLARETCTVGVGDHVVLVQHVHAECQTLQVPETVKITEERRQTREVSSSKYDKKSAWKPPTRTSSSSGDSVTSAEVQGRSDEKHSQLLYPLRKLTRSRGQLNLHRLSDEMDTTIESDEEMRYDTKKSSQLSSTLKSMENQHDLNQHDFIVCDVEVIPKKKDRKASSFKSKLMVNKDVQCSIVVAHHHHRDKRIPADISTKDLGCVPLSPSQGRRGHYSVQKGICFGRTYPHESSSNASVCCEVDSNKFFAESAVVDSKPSNKSDSSISATSSATKSTSSNESDASSTSTEDSASGAKEKSSVGSKTTSSSSDLDTHSSNARRSPSRMYSIRCSPCRRRKRCHHPRCNKLSQVAVTQTHDRNMRDDEEKPRKHSHRVERKTNLILGDGHGHVKDDKSMHCIAIQTSDRLNYHTIGTSTDTIVCGEETQPRLSFLNETGTQTRKTANFSALPNKFSPPWKAVNKDKTIAGGSSFVPEADDELKNELNKLGKYFIRLRKVEDRLEGMKRISPRPRIPEIVIAGSTTSDDYDHHLHHNITSSVDGSASYHSHLLPKKLFTSLPSSPDTQRRSHIFTTPKDTKDFIRRPLHDTEDRPPGSHRSTARSDLTATTSYQPSFIQKVTSFEPYDTKLIRRKAEFIEDFKPYNTNTNFVVNRSFSLDFGRPPPANTFDLTRNYPFLPRPKTKDNSTNYEYRHHRYTPRRQWVSSADIIRDNNATSDVLTKNVLVGRSATWNNATSTSSLPTYQHQIRHLLTPDTDRLLARLKSRLQDVALERDSYSTFAEGLQSGGRPRTRAPHRTSSSLGDLRPHDDLPWGEDYSSSFTRRPRNARRRLSFNPTFVTTTTGDGDCGGGDVVLSSSTGCSGDEAGLSDGEGSTECLLREAERLTRGASARSHRRRHHHHHPTTLTPHVSPVPPSLEGHHSTTPYLPCGPSDLQVMQKVKVLLPAADGVPSSSCYSYNRRVSSTYGPGPSLGHPYAGGDSTRGDTPFGDSNTYSKRGGGVAIGQVLMVDLGVPQEAFLSCAKSGVSRRHVSESLEMPKDSEEDPEVVVLLQTKGDNRSRRSVVRLPFSKVLLAWPL